MITEDKIAPALSEHGIDILIASTPMHVFYTSGLITSTTVTPHAENFEDTGFYFDTPQSPPKNLSIWTADHGGPYLVIAPNESGQLPNLDIEETFVYSPDGVSSRPSGELSERQQLIQRALENSHPSIYEALFAALDGLVDGDSHVALERMSLSPTTFEHISSGLPTETISEATPLLQELRIIKTDEEVRRLRRAAEVNERAIEDAIDELESGMTEREFANIFREKQARLGANNRHTHIGFGPNSANGHVVPGDRVIQPGDLIRFEVGCYYVDDSDFDRHIDPRHTYYPGDLARTYAFQKASEAHRAQYRVIHATMEKCRSLLAGGNAASDIHATTMEYARSFAREHGVTELVDWDRRMIGHNIGLDCHDHPLLSQEMRQYDFDTLEAGMVMNWEVGYYDHSVGGIQLEETGLITRDGVEAFTASPTTLEIVG